MRSFFILTLLFLQGLTPALYSGSSQKKIHVLMLCKAKGSCAESHLSDSAFMQENIKVIAAQAHMKLSLTVLQDSQVSLRNIKKWIAQFNTREARLSKSPPTDVIVVYYTGDRTNGIDQARTTWPVIKTEDSLLDRQQIEFLFCDQNFASFVLVLFDSYNTVENIAQRGWSFTRYPFDPSTPLPGALSLFTKSKGTLFISSSSQGKFSYGITYGGDSGGLLTSTFCRALDLANDPFDFWQFLIEKMRSQQNAIVGNNCASSRQEFYIDFSDLSNPEYQSIRQ